MQDTTAPVVAEAARSAERPRRPMSPALAVILIVHRYLAIAVGLLMTLWCLSGFVMMYQGYPRLTEAERIQGLAPLEFDGCCDVAALPFADDAAAPDLRVEMLLGTPVLRLSVPGPQRVFDLRTGLALPLLVETEALEVAREYGRRHGLAGEPRLVGTVEVDQWTIQTGRRHQPVYHIAYDDAAGSEIYVSGSSGEVFQDTNRRERVLTWLGAIPHWLYPTQLRQNGPLWSQVVIWTSILGTFLAATGLYVGVARLRRNRNGRFTSPFRGWWYWHHVSGLVFGVLTLFWVFSGLMTMNPWGAFAGTGAFDYVRAVRGAPTWAEVKELLASTPQLAGRDFVQISAASRRRCHEPGRALGSRRPARLRFRRTAHAADLGHRPVAAARGRHGRVRQRHVDGAQTSAARLPARPPRIRRVAAPTVPRRV